MRFWKVRTKLKTPPSPSPNHLTSQNHVPSYAQLSGCHDNTKPAPSEPPLDRADGGTTAPGDTRVCPHLSPCSLPLTACLVQLKCDMQEWVANLWVLLGYGRSSSLKTMTRIFKHFSFPIKLFSKDTVENNQTARGCSRRSWCSIFVNPRNMFNKPFQIGILTLWSV